VLDKLTFANNAYRDKKAVISFASGEREINIHVRNPYHIYILSLIYDY